MQLSKGAREWIKGTSEIIIGVMIAEVILKWLGF